MERDGKMGLAEYKEMDQLHCRRYMPGLDGLRALAVLAVIAYHLKLPWAPGGLLGVCIFFVLSGYLITDILVAQWNHHKSINLREFWMGRLRRLLPALFTMLGGVTLWIYLYDPSRLSSLWNEVLAALFYTSNWWLIFHQVSYFASFGPPSPLGHLWSLAVEEQFYLLWPLLLGLGLFYIPRKIGMIGLITALAIASAAAMAVIYQPGLDPNRVYYGTDTRAFALLIGAVLALLWPSRRLEAELSTRQGLKLDASGGAALLAILAMIWLSNQYQSFLYYGGLLLFSVISAILVAVLAHPASRLGRIFGFAPLRWLGMWSYGIYLWHYPVIVLTSPVTNAGGLDTALAIKQTVLSISLAAISWYFIENPIRPGRWKQPWALLSSASKLRPILSQLRIRASLTSVICIIGALILAVSGCSMITQKGSPAERLSIMGPANTALHTDVNKSVNSDANAPSASDTGNRHLDHEYESSGGGATVPGDSVVVGENCGTNGTKSSPANDAVIQDTDRGQGFTGRGVTVIGDSVMVGVESELKRIFPDITVNATIGRQMHQAPQVIKNLQAQGVLGKTVIIELGANGAFTEKQFMDILSLLGNDRRVLIINARVPKPWESAVNQALARTADSHPNVELINWYSASNGHNEYFRADGVHLQESGIKAYVALLATALTAEP